MYTLLNLELAKTIIAERQRAAMKHFHGHTAEPYKERLAKVTIGEPARLVGPIRLAEHDPDWFRIYRHHAARVAGALDRRALRIEHVGSTAVPGLPAKPIIDIALVVADSACEARYLPHLKRAGYRLRIREREWFEHRMLGDDHDTANLHVFSAGCDETDRMIRFRDWLRHNPADRDLYARVKRELAARDWAYVQQYADAKTDVIAAILARSAGGAR
jgi:GrpB-like predicted nucleotidyltransferase (UPF0157 family)